MTSSPLLQLDAISQRYARHSVVEQLSLSLQRGEIGCLLGSSGCGKTTVLRCIAGFEPLSGGRILIDGQLLADARLHTPAHKRQIGMVFQDYGLFPHLTVAGNVGFGLDALARDARAAQVARMLALVGLDGLAQRYPHELSGGQQQRVALARALVLEPEVLLFDEPLSNLDARLRREMREEIRALQQRLSLTVAYVTHDQAEAMAVSDQIIVMNQGLIAQKGSPRALYETPHSEFVAGFMGEAMLFPAVAGADGTVALGPLVLRPRTAVTSGPVKVAVRPEAWRIHRQGAGMLPARLDKRAYLGAVYEYTFETALGPIFVVSSDLDNVLAVGDEVQLSLGVHGVSVVGSTEAARTNAE